MIPKSISATALNVAQACPARFKAEHIDRGRGVTVNTAASVGSTVHGTLEDYVRMVYLDKTQTKNKKLIEDLYALNYVKIFGTRDTTDPEYQDGLELVQNWFARSDDLDEVKVLSVEQKTFFEVPTSAGVIPFNYIWDRFDEIKPGVFKVVDYKTNRWNITVDDLIKKVQARAYGLAAAIQLKAQGIEYERIWVEFDMLRHKPGPVGVVFTRQDNKNFWNFLINTLEDIIAMDDENPPERLNPECLFCVRKLACTALQKNIMVGGIHSVGSAIDLVDMRAHLDWQARGIAALIAEIDNKVLSEARLLDIEKFESEDNILEIGVGRPQRRIDADMAENVLGPRLFEKYGSKGLTMKSVDALLKGSELDAPKKAQLRALIYSSPPGEPRVKTRPKNPIDDD